MNMQKDLEKWADRTADLYHKLATKESDCNLAFYTQSDLRKIHERPELMILGINPGGYNTKYDEGSDAMVANQHWINHGVCGRMDGKTLIKGNPDFGTRSVWWFWNRLKNILSKGGVESIIDDDGKFIYTNIVLFNTVKANKIPAKAFDLVTQTVELIEITQPKRILCLGKNDCFARLEIKEVQELIPGELSAGRFGNNEIPIYGIPHTSKYYSHEEMDMIGSSLGYLFSREPDRITPEQLYEQVGTKIEAWKNRTRILK